MLQKRDHKPYVKPFSLQFAYYALATREIAKIEDTVEVLLLEISVQFGVKFRL